MEPLGPVTSIPAPMVTHQPAYQSQLSNHTTHEKQPVEDATTLHNNQSTTTVWLIINFNQQKL